jgi:drug/metabolite transporter (DMT)-like permease
VTPASTYLKLLLTMFVWGGTWVAARVVVQDVSPLAAACWRFLFASVSLLALVVLHRGHLPAISRRQVLQVIALGTSGIFLYNICFLIGMQTMAAGRGALVVALNPVMVTLGAWWLLDEVMSPAKALGSAIALTGCLTVIGNGSPLAPLAGEIGFGEWLILGCAVLWAAYTLIGRSTMRQLSPLVATAYASVAGWLMLLATTLASDPASLLPTYPLRAWTAIAFLGLLGTTLGFTWFNQAVKTIGATRASVFINLVPVAAVLQGAWLLDERLTPAVLLGGLLVLAGVGLTQRAATTTSMLSQR